MHIKITKYSLGILFVLKLVTVKTNLSFNSIFKSRELKLIVLINFEFFRKQIVFAFLDEILNLNDTLTL